MVVRSTSAIFSSSGETIDAKLFGLGTDGSLTPSGSLLEQAAKGREAEVERVTRKVNSLLMGLAGDVDTTSLDDIETALLRECGCSERREIFPPRLVRSASLGLNWCIA